MKTPINPPPVRFSTTIKRKPEPTFFENEIPRIPLGAAEPMKDLEENEYRRFTVKQVSESQDEDEKRLQKQKILEAEKLRQNKSRYQLGANGEKCVSRIIQSTEFTNSLTPLQKLITSNLAEFSEALSQNSPEFLSNLRKIKDAQNSDTKDNMITIIHNGNLVDVPCEVQCRLCGSKMRLTTRRTNYKRSLKESPVYRCLFYRCRTHRSLKNHLKMESNWKEEEENFEDFVEEVDYFQNHEEIEPREI